MTSRRSGQVTGSKASCYGEDEHLMADPSDSNDFFSGVDEMRRYLERHLQDPERRRFRLHAIATALPGAMARRDSGEWLMKQAREALGARGAVFLHCQPRWYASFSDGVLTAPPESKDLDRWVRSTLTESEIVVAPNGVILPLVGFLGPLGAIYLEGALDLDPTSRALLCALADTVATSLEAASAMEEVLRDPDTGLWNVQEWCNRVDSASHAETGVIVLGAIVGLDSVREAGGALAASQALELLVEGAAHVAPDGSILGSHFQRVLLFARCGPGESTATLGARLADLWRWRVRDRSARPGPSLSAVVVYAPARGSAAAAVSRLTAKLG